MAIVEFSRKDLCALVGRDMNHSEIGDLLDSIGVPLDSVEGDKMRAEVMPDRPDLLSVEGIARAISSFIGLRRGCRKYDAHPSGIMLNVDRSVKTVRPYIAAAVVRGLELNEALVASMMQLQEKLHDTVGRNRAKASIGLYDLNKIDPPIIYKAVRPGEVSFVPLESKERMDLAEILEKHQKGRTFARLLKGKGRYPILMDSKETVLSFPPIINSEDTKVHDETKNVFIDVTGTSERTVMDCLNIVCCALADRGGMIGSVRILDRRERDTPDLATIMSKISKKKINRILGTNLDIGTIVDCLERMGHDVKVEKKLVVESPCYRTDIMHEVDLIEEVAIGYGYMNLPRTLPGFVTIGMPDEGEEMERRVREVMVGFGFMEVMNFYITNEDRNFRKMEIVEEPCVRIKNPLNVNYTIFRTWCTPSLMQNLSYSKDEKMPQKIFEIGHVAIMKGRKAEEMRKMAAALAGPHATFTQMKSIADAFMREMGMEYQLWETSHGSFIDGRVADIVVFGRKIGIIGEIHPKVLNNFGIEQPVVVFEIFLSQQS